MTVSEEEGLREAVKSLVEGTTYAKSHVTALSMFVYGKPTPPSAAALLLSMQSSSSVTLTVTRR